MTTHRRITSTDNPEFRAVRDLAHSARERRRHGRSLLEGVHLCESWLAHCAAPRSAFVSDSGLEHPEAAALLARQPLRPIVLSDALFAELSTLQRAVGIAFVVDTPRPALPAAIDADALYLDRIQDPGNVGTLLRCAAAAGIGRVITAPGTAWCWSPKVLRAGMGAHFALAIHEAVPWSTVRERLAVPAVGTRLSHAEVLWDCDLREDTLWLFGNEGEGLSGDLVAEVRRWVRIPQAGGVDSLNVAAAAAVCLFEQQRQRGARR